MFSSFLFVYELLRYKRYDADAVRSHPYVRPREDLQHPDRKFSDETRAVRCARQHAQTRSRIKCRSGTAGDWSSGMWLKAARFHPRSTGASVNRTKALESLKERRTAGRSLGRAANRSSGRTGAAGSRRRKSCVQASGGSSAKKIASTPSRIGQAASCSELIAAVIADPEMGGIGFALSHAAHPAEYPDRTQAQVTQTAFAYAKAFKILSGLGDQLAALCAASGTFHRLVTPSVAHHAPSYNAGIRTGWQTDVATASIIPRACRKSKCRADILLLREKALTLPDVFHSGTLCREEAAQLKIRILRIFDCVFRKGAL